MYWRVIYDTLIKRDHTPELVAKEIPSYDEYLRSCYGDSNRPSDSPFYTGWAEGVDARLVRDLAPAMYLSAITEFLDAFVG